MPFRSHRLLSKLLYDSLISRLLCSDQRAAAAALNYSPETQALPFNGQILRQPIGREDSGSLGGERERAILTERNAVSWLFFLRCLPSSELQGSTHELLFI